VFLSYDLDMEISEEIVNKYVGFSSDELLRTISSQQETITTLQANIAAYQQMLFRKKSERHVGDPIGIQNMFDIAEHPNDEVFGPHQETPVSPHTRKNRGKRKPLSDSLPRERVEHDLPEEQKICKVHGVALEKIGESITEQLEIIPASAKVIQNVTFSYKCRCCSEQNSVTCIVKSQEEPKIIPKSFATASLLAYIVTAKFQDALPLYRQEKIFDRLGIDLSRTTMARWLTEVYGKLTPLLNLMEEDLMSRNVICCDETPLQVLGETNRRPDQMSYMWVACSNIGPPITLFRYYDSRSAKVAREFLADFRGTVVCDGLKSYDSAAKDLSFILAGCMAHIRRKFFTAEKAAIKASPKAQAKASYAIALIKKLYRIEAELKGEPPDKILARRTSDSAPLMREFKTWLDREVSRTLPRSLLGKALGYALGQWDKMQVFLRNPEVDLDNNYCERQIRPFVIGRKNWVFSQSCQGADASAALYSLIETSKANGLEPFSYLNMLFKELPKVTDLSGYERLLPHKASEFFQLNTYKLPS
jgi:transposase